MRGVFAEPCGVDFAAALAAGLRARLAGAPPEAMARTTLLVNTSRMARRTEAALAAAGATLLPQIGLVSQLAPLLPPGRAPAAEAAPLALRLALTRLVAALLEARPDLSPTAAAFDLAGTLEALLAEMQEEGMNPAAFETLDAADLSEHWQRSLTFLRIVAGWHADGASPGLTAAAAQRIALDRLLAIWQDAPPDAPFLVAGSTGSRAPTRRLIGAVTDLPQGVVILPGLDFDMPDTAWDALLDGEAGQQDHPQFRHAALLAGLGLGRADVPRWSEAAPASAARNRLLSLALRPAPATDAWRDEGPGLADVAEACAGITLLRAPSPGAEAAAIAAGLRGALADGRRAALITPDRNLARRVSAELDRWGILPDDSAGRPLSQTAPGRLLLLCADMRGRRVEAEALVILLQHPLTATGGDRIAHLKAARDLDLRLIRKAPLAFPDRDALGRWFDGSVAHRAASPWSDWLARMLDALSDAPGPAPLATHVARHRALAEALAGGPGDAPGALWDDAAGRAARDVMDRIAESADHRGDDVEAFDYLRILQALLRAEEARDSFSPHSDAMIWGALEARIRSADLVILGGLTDDVWPGRPAPDPWLNRAMRRACGLRLPEREIGLSAHDFQQAAAGGEVWLSRALRDAEADTVPSRWLNRIEGLLGGIGPDGEAALAGMGARGQVWLDRAAELARPQNRHKADPAPRPAPVPPPGKGLSRLSVTAVETLIRDPYAVYARALLRLHPLPPLRQGPDARLRGSAIHLAMQRFAEAVPGALPADAAERLRGHLAAALAELAPWPGARAMWLGKFERPLPDFLEAEATRRALGRPRHVENDGTLVFADPPFTLTARADRIDDRGDAVAIYDYKTGSAPSEKEQSQFAKQLLLEALMVREGAFPAVAQRRVDEVAYLTLGAKYEARGPKDFGPDLIARTRADLLALLRSYAEGQPFISRLSPDLLTYASDYDLLARLSEWDDTTAATPIPVGR